PMPPTLSVVNARIWTGDPRRPWADGLSVTADRITAVGSSAEIRKGSSSGTRVVDAKGMMVVPGFIDAHIHFLEGGTGLSSVQLRDAKTRDEFVRRIADFAETTTPGTWITNGDWDHEWWGGELPTRDWIDAVTPGNPVWLSRLDHHMSLANSLGLSIAGITRDTADVDGGTIVRDGGGEPTGVLKDNAEVLVDRILPPPTAEQSRAALDAAMRYVASNGVTSVHHVGTWEDLAVFEHARRDNALRTRIYAAVPISTWERLRDYVATNGRGDAWLKIGGLKGFVDGSLGSHTAAMLEPFTDAPNDRGLLVNSLDDLYRWSSGADAAALHLIVHAIGDRAIREQLNIFERVARENGARDRRSRIEHAQHLAASDVRRFAELGVIASVQPYHAIDDGRWAEKVIGAERAQLTYAFRALRDSRAHLAFGSDWPVAPATPLEGIYAAVTRRTLDDANPDGWIPAQKINVEDALRGYTSGAAYASFDETEKGMIARGMLADFVMIDRDLTRVAPETIRDASIVMTVVGGEIVHGA
ncbi:MAG TPA: amidohydrolase, partial [Gemmatimonadaceae bacterium]